MKVKKNRLLNGKKEGRKREKEGGWEERKEKEL